MLEKRGALFQVVMFIAVACVILSGIGTAIYLIACSPTEWEHPSIYQVENGLTSPTNKTPANVMDRMALYKVQGLSVAVIRDYQMAWAKGYGWADTDQKRPVTTATRFQAASISKSLNSLGLLRLVQEHKLDLYANINTYLHSWKFPYDPKTGGKNISLANLLSHTAGLNVHGFRGYETGMALPSTVQILDGVPPANSNPVRSQFAPGLRFEYSGGGTTISQLMVMDVTRRRYVDFIQEKVLAPLGMTSSSFSQPTNIDPSLLSTGYYKNGTEIQGKFHIYPEQAAAGLWTTPSDLAKYIIETQLAYEGKSEKVLDQTTTKLRLTPYANPSAALGVFVGDLDGVTYFQHSGSNAGFRSHYYGSLSGGNGVVVMVNSDNDTIIPEVIISVAKVYGFKGLDKIDLNQAY